jgi:hypothetical protein
LHWCQNAVNPTLSAAVLTWLTRICGRKRADNEKKEQGALDYYWP